MRRSREWPDTVLRAGAQYLAAGWTAPKTEVCCQDTCDTSQTEADLGKVVPAEHALCLLELLMRWRCRLYCSRRAQLASPTFCQRLQLKLRRAHVPAEWRRRAECACTHPLYRQPRNWAHACVYAHTCMPMHAYMHTYMHAYRRACHRSRAMQLEQPCGWHAGGRRARRGSRGRGRVPSSTAAAACAPRRGDKDPDTI